MKAEEVQGLQFVRLDSREWAERVGRTIERMLETEQDPHLRARLVVALRDWHDKSAR